jgi:hypothetical protein
MFGNKNLTIGAIAAVAVVVAIAAYFMLQGEDTAPTQPAAQPAPQSTPQPAPTPQKTPDSQPK